LYGFEIPKADNGVGAE